VVFCLTDDYPEADLRHYTFMLEGLKDVQEALEKRGIKMVVCGGSPEDVALDAGKDASLLVTDRGYMRPQKKWRKKVACEVGCPVTQVEFASDKHERADAQAEYLDERKAKPEQYVEKVEKRIAELRTNTWNSSYTSVRKTRQAEVGLWGCERG
jgi:deoxyribodipyrimidine photolyase